MKTYTFLSVLLLTSTHTNAGPLCTDEPKEAWMSQKEMKKMINDAGYRIKLFKVTSGNCYEFYGWDKEGRKVEIYHNPITGEPVKTNIRS